MITVGYDLYFVSFWNTSFWWHQNHVFAHCTFLISEYAACGYLAFKVELDTIGVESLLTFLGGFATFCTFPIFITGPMFILFDKFSRPSVYSKLGN